MLLGEFEIGLRDRIKIIVRERYKAEAEPPRRASRTPLLVVVAALLAAGLATLFWIDARTLTFTAGWLAQIVIIASILRWI